MTRREFNEVSRGMVRVVKGASASFLNAFRHVTGHTSKLLVAVQAYKSKSKIRLAVRQPPVL